MFSTTMQDKSGKPTLTASEAREIARDAYIYGFPIVDNYRIQYAYFVDKKNAEYKGMWNEVHNTARVYTPEDKAIQTPNSDTPYSMIGADLRAEPLVLSVPDVEEGRYYSVQFIDAYTFNFAYVGSRATGNKAGNYLLAGPDWKGNIPSGINQVIRSETQLAFVIIRTQLFNTNDIGNVQRIQKGYKLQPLSKFAGTTAPAAATPIPFATPLSAAVQKTSPLFFAILNFSLQYCSIHPTELQLFERFSKLQIGAFKDFNIDAFAPEIQKAIEEGIEDAWRKNEEVHKLAAMGKASSGEFFGSREWLKNNYPYRMAAAVAGIYGNSQEEAIYPAYYVDADGNPLDTANNKYVLHFDKGQLPPVNAFWSLTMYTFPESLLYANSINRYLINSPMLPDLKKDADGGLTLYIQHDSPGQARESNWLPAPSGRAKIAMRLYWPKEEAYDGSWKAPKIAKV